MDKIPWGIPRVKKTNNDRNFASLKPHYTT